MHSLVLQATSGAARSLPLAAPVGLDAAAILLSLCSMRSRMKGFVDEDCFLRVLQQARHDSTVVDDICASMGTWMMPAWDAATAGSQIRVVPDEFMRAALKCLMLH